MLARLTRYESASTCEERGHGLDPWRRRSRWAPTITIPRRRPRTGSASTASGWTATPSPTRRSRRFVEATGHVTVAERPPDPADYPGARPELLVPVSRGVPDAAGRRSTCATRTTGGSTSPARTGGTRRGRAAARSSGCDDHPVVHVAWEDVAAYADVGGQGSCRPRPSGSSPRAAGWTAPSTPGATSSRRAACTWPTPGRASSRSRTSAGRLRGHRAGRLVPGQRLRPVRDDRQRLGVDDRLVRAEHAAAPTSPCCAPPRNPRGRRARGELRPAAAGRAHPAAGDQGRLAPVRAELLPPLPARGAACRSRSTPRPATSASAASSVDLRMVDCTGSVASGRRTRRSRRRERPQGRLDQAYSRPVVASGASRTSSRATQLVESTI